MQLNILVILLCIIFPIQICKSDVSNELDVDRRLVSDEFENVTLDSVTEIVPEAKDEFIGHPNLNLLPGPGECGLVSPRERRLKRVARGRRVYPGDVAGLVVINSRDSDAGVTGDEEYVNGNGVLINSKYVLTTASVIWRLKEHYISSVGLGLNQRSAPVHNIEEIVVHEYADQATRENDVALIRLRKPVIFNGTYEPICLPLTKVNMSDDIDYITAGYGALSSSKSDSLPTYANYADMELIPYEKCDRVYSTRIGRSPTDKICGRSVWGAYSGLCQGTDFGAPLIASDPVVGSKSVRQTLVGMASYYVGCGLPGLPTVFTNVTNHVNWILDNLKP